MIAVSIAELDAVIHDLLTARALERIDTWRHGVDLGYSALSDTVAVPEVALPSILPTPKVVHSIEPETVHLPAETPMLSDTVADDHTKEVYPLTRKQRTRSARKEPPVISETPALKSPRVRPKQIPHQRTLHDEPLKENLFDKQSTRAETGYNSDGVADYLRAIGKVDLLTDEEEVVLAKAIELGRAAETQLPNCSDALTIRRLKRHISEGRAARERFVVSNLRLVVNIAKRYPLPTGMDLLDLVQEGNLGMAHAVEKFDWRKGFKFSTYATFWIRQAIGRALDQKATLIRLPGDKSAELRASLRRNHGDGNQLSSEQAELHRLSTTVSMDKKIGDDGDTSFGDLLASALPGPEETVITDSRRELLYTALAQLADDRGAFALRLRFGLETGNKMPFQEVGRELGVTAEAARRLVYRKIEELKGDPKIIRLLGDL